jgi:prolyl-tRNA synthetase
MAKDIYAKLRAAGRDVLLDDGDGRPGEKFATMDLLGLPWQAIIGPRGVKSGTVEVKRRRDGAREDLALDAAFARLSGASA